MTANTAPQVRCKTVAELRLAAASFLDVLDAGESLVDPPTVTEVGTSDLTIDNVIVNTDALFINRLSVPAGKAVQFSIAGGVAGTEYTINIQVSTDATPAQTLVGNVCLLVLANS